MAEADEEKSDEIWMYLDEQGKHSGPRSWAWILERDGDDLVWRDGLKEWMRRSKLEEEGWFYSDGDGASHGPMLVGEIEKLVSDGVVDGLTMFWKKGMDQWQPVSEIVFLREILVRTLKDEDEEDGGQNDGAEEDDEEDSEDEDEEGGGADYDDLDVKVVEVKESAPGMELSGADGDHGLKMLKEEEEKRLQKKRKREREKLKKLMKNNSSIYFAGIPPSTTEEEIVKFFSKCGIIKPDPETDKPKVKLYRGDDGKLKGDGLVTYLLQPSVENAILLLDGTEFQEGWKVEVRKAEFKIKGNTYMPRPKRQKGGSNAQKVLKEKALGWNEGVDDGRGLRIVILKHCFTPSKITDLTEYEELEEDIGKECSKLGEVEKVTIFKFNPDGVVAVKFKKSNVAESCIEVMDGRFFDGQKLEADFYDGKSDFRVKETEEQRQKREKEWEKFLESKEPE